MIERLLCGMVLVPLIAAVACMAQAFDRQAGDWAIAAAVFFIGFVMLVGQAFGARSSGAGRQ
ncbi:MAG: hypothetical protein PF961_22070 [Planctomycetota bacterium]|jgi:hypothetical protein|nr:hypothetical protein [Planctomycetota bacterium]